MQIVNFKSAQTLPDSFFNTNLTSLNLAQPTATDTSLSAAEGADFGVAVIEISSKITLSGVADSPSITML